MSYVVPNGSVKILKDVPIERNYEHSLYFANAGAQYSYFNSKVKGAGYSFSDMSHIRVTTPGRKIRVPININNLYDCNYMIIQNNGNSGKVFYCFIDNVEYLNENVSEITYSIDTIQTWMFEYSSGGVLNHQCFVERETVANDTVGLHVLSEGLETGDLISGSYYIDPHFDIDANNPLKIVLMATANLDVAGLVPPMGGFINGCYHQLDFETYTVPASGVISENTLLDIYNKLRDLSIFDRTNTIVNFLMMPSKFIGSFKTNWNVSLQDSQIDPYVVPNFSPTLGNYTPKNNKLLTYPYTFFTVSNGEGDIKEYKYELFSNVGIRFYEYCDFSPEPSVAIVPYGYNQPNFSSGYVNDYSNALRFTNFPKCCYAVNDLAAKFVQAGIGVAVAATTSGLLTTGEHSSGSTKFMSSNPYSHYSGNIGGLTSSPGKHESGGISNENSSVVPKHYSGETTMTERQLRSTAPVALAMLSRALFTNKISSFPGNGNINLCMGIMGFEFRQKYIRPEIAKMIDDYFTMYGYLVNVVKNPSIHNRTKWTYVKTSGCTVGGSIPNDDADEICNVFDNGITFWVNPSEVGNYSLTNNTLSYSLLNTNEDNNAVIQETNPTIEG